MPSRGFMFDTDDAEEMEKWKGWRKWVTFDAEYPDDLANALRILRGD